VKEGAYQTTRKQLLCRWAKADIFDQSRITEKWESFKSQIVVTQQQVANISNTIILLDTLQLFYYQYQDD
jgi:hypothetical protein